MVDSLTRARVISKKTIKRLDVRAIIPIHACMIPLSRQRFLKLLGIKMAWVGVMGCICSKGRQQPKNGGGGKSKDNKGKKCSKRSASKRDEEIDTDEYYDGGLGIFPLTPNDDQDDKKNKKKKSRSNHHFSSVANGEKAAPVVAGWPSWLTAVAGEAINGWIPRRLDSFEKLEKIGQGTYSSVYKARDLESTKIVALKKVRFANMDPESVKFMAREIIILRRLDHPNVMKLEGIITTSTSGSLYLVFEYMDHDLSGLLSSSGSKFTESQIKCYMKQLLSGLAHCHSRGIMHRDIKGANLLIDSKGNLKIADFGLATFRTTKPTTTTDNRTDKPYRRQLTSRVVSLWYRPPELLLGSTDYGVEVDLWSSGCILAELFNGGKPILPGRTEVEQIHKIFKLCGSPSEEYWKSKTSKLSHTAIFKPRQRYERRVGEKFKDTLPSSALGLVEALLSVDPENRGSTASALASEFFTTEPLPCEPSSLPNYPPSKEFDVKLREDENKRKRVAGGKGKGRESERIFTRGAKVIATINSNIDVHISAKRRKERDQREKATTNNERPKNKKEAHDHEANSNGTTSTRNAANSLDELVAARRNSSNQTTSSTRRGGAAATAANYKLSRFSNSVVIRDNSTSSKGDRSSAMDSTRKGSTSMHMHHSGPLMTAGGNIEEMLKEHERRIQHAVRKARSAKNNNFHDHDDDDDVVDG